MNICERYYCTNLSWADSRVIRQHKQDLIDKIMWKEKWIGPQLSSHISGPTQKQPSNKIPDFV